MTTEFIELLPAMPLFVAVAKARSFSKAARTLGMPVSTLSRRVSELEARLGLQLLSRTTRHVELTSAGENYFERCRSILEAAEAAHAELKGQRENPRGHLRISATPDFASTFLLPLFVGFADRYPDISFEFDLTPRSVDLVAEGIDVAIRIGKLPDSQLTARRLCAVRSAFYASPAYLSRTGAPRQPADLSAHECICMRRSAQGKTKWELERGNKRVEVSVSGRFLANNMRFPLQLAMQGLGIALIDMEMARPEIEAARLVRVLPEWSQPPVAVHALTPSRLMPAKTRVLLESLAEHLRGLEDVTP